MIIATSITESYLEKSKPFFESVNKHFKGKRICFCIDFDCQIKGWETIYVPKDEIKCQWQPKNRKEFYTFQYGEFVEWYDFKDSDTVLFVDSDMVLQRKLDIELKLSGTFFVTDSSFPAAKIKDVIQYPELGFNGNIEDFCMMVGISDQHEEFCTGLLCASIEDWKQLYSRIKTIHGYFLKHFNHHSLWQTLINVIVIATCNIVRLSPIVCNATWYLGTKAKRENNKLMYQNSEVYFVHTKFNEEYEY